MEQALAVLGAIIWGFLLLSILVFVHEGGHFLAARLFGVRVKAFYLGLPCKIRLHHESKKLGTDYGVTPLLLGGYTAISGMEPVQNNHLAIILAYVQQMGRVSYEQAARDLNLSEDDVVDGLFTLNDWGSIEPYIAEGEKLSSKEVPRYFQTVERDQLMRTKYDRHHDFSGEKTHKTGTAQPLNMDAEAFLKQERSHTYASCGFWKRFTMLIAGIFINVLLGFLLLVVVFSVLGTPQAQNVNRIGEVAPGSLAQTSGLIAGDTITTVGDATVDSWTSLVEELQIHLSSGVPFGITYLRDGVAYPAEITPSSPGQKLGITAPTQIVRVSPLKGLTTAANYVGMTASYIVQLLNPQQTGYIIENSTSLVGISVMAQNAVSQGLSTFLLLAAAVSLSLGFMNLLPIPPLDGGRIVIEAIQAITKKTIPPRVVQVITFVGVALFLLLFFVLLRQDIVRFIIPS